MNTKAKKNCEDMPDILEFLKILRSAKSQIEILSGVNISVENRTITKRAVVELVRAASAYVEGDLEV